MVIGLVLLVVLVVLAVLFVVVPILRAADAGNEWATTSAAQLRLVDLRERRDNALLALRELELDRETGKLDDRDYAAANADLRAEALAALAALDDDIRSISASESAADAPPKEVAPPAETVEDAQAAADRRADS
jgi:uncharacterized protein YqfA (UPF0365 family)